MNLRHRLFLLSAVLLLAATAFPLVNAKPSKTKQYSVQSLSHKAGAQLLHIIAEMDPVDGNACGMCFVPDVGPEDPSCGDCHLACNVIYDARSPNPQCGSCSNYDHGYDCGFFTPILYGEPLTSAVAKDVFTLPSDLHPGRKVILRYAGMEKHLAASASSRD